jgi:hypothetical protein
LRVVFISSTVQEIAGTKKTLTVDEIDEALFRFIHKSQELAYPEE